MDENHETKMGEKGKKRPTKRKTLIKAWCMVWCRWEQATRQNRAVAHAVRAKMRKAYMTKRAALIVDQK